MILLHEKKKKNQKTLPEMFWNECIPSIRIFILISFDTSVKLCPVKLA